MPEQLRNCPKCGSEDALETFLRIDLDDVVVANGEVVSFILAGSANDPSNGIVVEEATVTCRDCGEVVEALVPMSITGRWTYRESSKRIEQAQQLCHLLNGGWLPTQALASLGIDPDDTFSSNAEVFELDDDDNTIVDLGFDEHGVCAYVQKHADRWHVHTVTKED